MQPSASGSGEYECFDCGRRYERPETGVCEFCGGELYDLGTPRDA